METIHEGGCVCGGVRYRTTGNPQRVSACACRWCQKRTGSAFGLTVYFKESLKTCIAVPDGIALHYANYTWTGKLGSIKRHFGRKSIIESREKAIQELQARLDGSVAAE